MMCEITWVDLMGYILTIVGHVQGDVVALDEHIFRQILNTRCDKL